MFWWQTQENDGYKNELSGMIKERGVSKTEELLESLFFWLAVSWLSQLWRPPGSFSGSQASDTLSPSSGGWQEETLSAAGHGSVGASEGDHDTTPFTLIRAETVTPATPQRDGERGLGP